MGTGGEDYWVRMSQRVSENWPAGLQLDRATVGSTRRGIFGVLPEERRTGGAVDLSYRFLGRYTLFAQYEVVSVKNREFRAGNDGFEHLLRVELTRSFR